MAKLVIGTTKTNGVPAVVTTAGSSVSEPYREYMVKNGLLRSSDVTSRIINISGALDIQEFALAKAYYNVGNAISGTADFSSLTNVSGQYAFYEAFSSAGIDKLDLSSLGTIGAGAKYSLYRMCANAAVLSEFDLSSLVNIAADRACSGMFYGTTNLTGEADLSSLVTISGSNACDGMFTDSAISSVDLSSLATMGGYQCCANMFYRCTRLTTVTFTSLTSLTNGYVLQNAFQACSNLQSLYFPALNGASFGSYNNQFSGMLTNCSGVTVHFPSNLDPAGGSTVISSKSGYPNFGGSNITLAFDLTATN